LSVILLTGVSGQLGRELLDTLAPLGRVVAPNHAELDLADPDAIRATVRAAGPSVIVNAAAYTAVDKAEAEPAMAARINTAAPETLAAEAKRCGALLIHYSTDYVFDGLRTTPYTEADTTHPLSVYGRTKLEGEHAIAASGCRHLILRTSWVYSARRSNFVLTMLKLARERSELAVVADQVGSPTWARALARATTTILQQIAAGNPCAGLYHLTSSGAASRYELVRQIIELARAGNQNTAWANLREAKTADFPLPAARPLYSVLDNTKIHRDFGVVMPSWEKQLQEFITGLPATNTA
jgi:dTDP-4-dehydrorhamnose reductase